VPCYGISQDPVTKNYIIVMDYMEGGNLRQYLISKKLNFSDKLQRLFNIVQGLKNIHQKNLVHRDFHSGNILNSGTHSFIADLGLCRPVNEIGNDKVYGVLPYVAPEVLRDKKYTQAADIYSFGMIAYELFSGLPPYCDYVHDSALALRICEGLRPKFQIKVPQLLVDLIEKC